MAEGRRRKGVLIVASIAVLIALAVLTTGVFALGWFRGTPSAASSPAPVTSSAPPMKLVKALKGQLESGDPVKLASALDLDPSQVTPEEITGFATSRLDFDIVRAKAYGHGTWQMPVTITQKGGAKSTWTATVVSGPNGLVLLDTRERK